MSIKSCIYEGTIRHRRFEPVNHEFQYRVFMMYVDLDELANVFDKHWFWSTKRPNLAWFRRADYLDRQTNSLSDSVRELVKSRLGVTPDGPIRLLTHFRYFGYTINPISLYYCFNAKEEVEYVVAEVTNTPWREKHAYVFDARNAGSGKMNFMARKELHVSPFLEMDYEYRFRMSLPEKNLSVHIENHRMSFDTRTHHGSGQLANESTSEEYRPAFEATLTMGQQPLTSSNLARVVCRYPFMTAQVFGKIHWQAFRLLVKKVKFQKHPRTQSTASKPPGFTPSVNSTFPTHQNPVEKTVL